MFEDWEYDRLFYLLREVRDLVSERNVLCNTEDYKTW